MIILRVVVFAAGLVLVANSLFSAIRTFVVPRGATDRLTRLVFSVTRNFFALFLIRRSKRAREGALAYYSPVTLLTLPIVWLACVLVGYTCIYWALGGNSWNGAFSTSRLSLLSLSSNVGDLPGGPIIAFSETAFSVLLAAILVAYLPTMYSAFSQREATVTGLETRAGAPPTPLKMIFRYYTIHGMDQISEIWDEWQRWFEVVEESHTALQPLVLYRSPQPNRSWITAAGAVLDSASIVASTLDRPRDPRAELCIRAGYICLQRIANVFDIPYDPEPSPSDPISVSRSEYDEVYDALVAKGIPVKDDRDQCWRDFAGWRVNYDIPLVALTVLIIAPPAPWSSDRVPYDPSRLRRARKAAREVAAQMLERYKSPQVGESALRVESAPTPKTHLPANH